MSYIDEVFGFVKDQTLSFSKKSLIIIGIVILVCVIDFSFGISFNYSINQKLNQVEKIESIKNNYLLNDTLLANLNEIEFKLLNRFDYVKILHFHESKIKGEIKNLPDKIKKILKDSTKLALRDTTKVVHGNEILDTKIHKELKSRNWMWDLVSSTFIYLFAFLFLLIVPFTQKSSFLQTLLGTIIIMIALGFVCWLTYWIFSNIPTIIRPWVNYIVNAIIHTIIVGIVIYAISQAGKKK